MENRNEECRALGRTTEYPTAYAPDILEAVKHRHPDTETVVQLNCPEFTSLCPITSQPDFANIIIKYIPDEALVESKSLKLYLFSFRNHGDFHEDCINIIAKDLFNLLRPRWIKVSGEFTPRGGISIWPSVELGEIPGGCKCAH